MSTDFKTIRYAVPADGVARITLARPEKRNAQTMAMLVELNDAFDRAAHDNDIKVIILDAEGRDFSSGHGGLGDLDLDSYQPVGTWKGFKQPGAEGQWAMEAEFYMGFCMRWRDLPKPTIAAVKGWVIAGGLMLCWPCDIIIAAEDTKFTDPVVAFGVNGVEYFGHPWEFGIRKAKELLFTGEVMLAEEARQLGMVNHVVANDELDAFTLDMATRIAKRPLMGLKLAKQSVNQAQDAMGFRTAQNAAFSLQQLGHTHARVVHDGVPVDRAGQALIQEVLEKYKESKNR